MKTKTKLIACAFAEWISLSWYEDMWRDIDKDGRVWSSRSEMDDIREATGKHPSIHETPRFTIHELLDKFLINNDLD